MKYAMLVDINRCSICFSCQVACKDEFVGNPYPPYSMPQSDREPSWITVSEVEHGKYPYVKVYPIPVLCMHCENAPCMDACPVPGAIYRNNTGVVIIDPAKCNGCKKCQQACPYQVIVFNEDRKICQKCTLCQHKLQAGKIPACVDACPSGVFYFGEESAVIKEAQKRNAETMKPENKTKPRIYYLGLPSESLAGHVIDAQSLMDVTGAGVKITNTVTGSKISLKTNLAGNFIGTHLNKDNVYSLEIQCQGYLSKTINNIRLDLEYKHLGDIKLDRA
jgi:tetrathionate reductase subunit B